MARAPSLSSWIQAARPRLQVGVLVSLAYGEALAFARHGAFSPRIALEVLVFGFLDGLLIAFSNDAVDWRTDTDNRTFTRWSGGSRVVPEGLITPFSLAQAALLAVLALGTTGAYLAFREGRAFMVVIAAIAAHLVWLHGFSPFRLAYRGLGDLIAGIGFGVVLPVAGFYAQANTVEGLNIATLFPAFLVGFAASVTTSVPDAPSDARAEKRTIAVRRGERTARQTSVALLFVAAFSTSLAVPGVTLPIVIVVIAIAATLLRGSIARLASGDSENREACAEFVGGNLRAALGLYVLWGAAAVLCAGRF
ncbi:MAG TPA: prenyltransferase [Polyangiaceae bacterium]|nr:prenyltransferase [Polyangiaceae bacterium]